MAKPIECGLWVVKVRCDVSADKLKFNGRNVNSRRSRASEHSMKRANTGYYVTTSAGGERVDAFVPRALPPDPALAWDGNLASLLSEASSSIGRLDGSARVLPNKQLFIDAYVKKEAVLSSQIEGTRSSLSDLYRYELDGRVARGSDVVEVSNYVEAMNHGLDRLRGGFPISNRLIREIHEVLMSRGVGANKSPGEFRRSQVWIGGTRPGNAVFVPPPHTEVENCMGELERFMNASDDGIPPLVRAALAHVQFETIHPFLDGNGRVGRLLITLLLIDSGVLNEPVVYLSLYLKSHRHRYYELLDESGRRTGDWEARLTFFLEGVIETADNAYQTTDRLGRMFDDDRARIEGTGRRAGSGLKVFAEIMKRPEISIAQAAEATGLSFPAASSALSLLGELGIVREVTGRSAGRVFQYSDYLETLEEGAEAIGL